MRRITLSVFIVIGLAYIAFWYHSKSGSVKERAQATKVRHDCRFLCGAAQKYFDRFGRYPDQLAELESLLTGEPDDRGPDRRLVDPWGRPYRYAVTAAGVEFVSLGRDGAPGGSGQDKDRGVALRDGREHELLVEDW